MGGCAPVSDLAYNLQLKCGATDEPIVSEDLNLREKQSFDVAGTKITVSGIGRIRFTFINRDSGIEYNGDQIVFKGRLSPFDDNYYKVRTEVSPTQESATHIHIAYNCKDPKNSS